MMPGLHFPINPFMTFDTYSTKDIRVSLKELRVPSQDKLKSIVDITVMLQFDGAKAPFSVLTAVQKVKHWINMSARN